MRTVLLRIVSVFTYSSMATIGGGAIIGVEVWKAAALAGLTSTIHVVEKLARAYADDGVITMDELNAAFQIKQADD